MGNGPPFNGSKFANFAQEQRFRHRKDTTEWAEAHNDVKRFMQTLKKSARTSKLEGEAIREGVQRTVGSYRATPAQRQRKALTSSCSAESYGGSYRKGSYPQEKFSGFFLWVVMFNLTIFWVRENSSFLFRTQKSCSLSCLQPAAL